MKFFIILALATLAVADNAGYNKLNYKFNGQPLVIDGRNVYSGSLSSGASGYGSSSSGSYGSSSGSYGSGLSSGFSGGVRYGSSGSSSRLVSSGGYGSGASYGLAAGSHGARGGNVILAQLIPVSGASVGVASSGYGAGLSAGYGQSAGYSAGYSQSQSSGPITAAVQSTRNVQYVDAPSTGPSQPQTIVIPPNVQPLDFEFQSQSSPVTVRQTHIPGQPSEPQSSSHTEEPDYLRQEIVKPIVHEVTEAIQPYRKINQEIRPVLEEVNQLVTRGQQQQASYHQQASYSRPQASSAHFAVQAAPIQTAAVQTVALQPVATAQIVAAQPAYGVSSGLGLSSSGLSGSSYGGSYSSGISSGLSGGLSGLSGQTFLLQPVSSGSTHSYNTLSSSSYSPDNY